MSDPATPDAGALPSATADPPVDAGARSQPPPPEPHEPDYLRRLRERRVRHRERNKVYRAGVAVAGFLITLAGVIVTGPIPGPGFLIIPVGLFLLALEFDWAERLLHRAVAYAERSKRKAAEASRTQKILTGVATALGIAAFAVAAILWDIPVLPV